MSSKKLYSIYFGILNNPSNGNQNKRQSKISCNAVTIKEDFSFYDYDSSSTIGYLKEYFLTTFGHKYRNYCKCVLSLYCIEKKNYCLLLQDDNKKKLSECKYDKLYLIKVNNLCDCEFKMYNKYMNMDKFDLIAEIKKLNEDKQKLEKTYEDLEASNNKVNLDNLNLKSTIDELSQDNRKLKKIEEFKNFQNHDLEENFYDIVININSITSVSTEGWDVKFNPKIFEKFKEQIKMKKEQEKKHKEEKEKENNEEQEEEQKTITIGVLGNNNKGKSFLLSRISKIKLLTGTSIETKGLSVKYPELEGFKGRQLILLDSAGLETPVLKKTNNIQEGENPKSKEENNQQNNKIEDKSNEQNNKQNEESEEKLNEKEFKRNKIFKNNARDKIMTELFLENFIIRFSDILLVVVGKLTYSEQLLINKIKVESKKQNKGRIFIIHNLQEFREVKQVEDYIKNTLLKCSTFDLKKRTWITAKKDKEKINFENEYNKGNENEIKENEIDNDKENEIKNEIDNDKENEIKNENNNDNQNEIKNEINNDNQNEIKNEINNDNQNEIKEKKEPIIKENDNNNNPKKKLNKNEINEENVKEESKLNDVHFTETLYYGDHKKLDVFHLILANEDSKAGDIYNKYTYDFIEGVYNLISEPKKFDVFEVVKENFKMLSNTIFINNIKEFKFTEEEQILEKRNMKLITDSPLSLKKCFTDELGFSLFKTGNFEPKYNYFKSDEQTLEIRLEVPGNTNCKVNHKVIGDKTIITVFGEKNRDKTPKDEKDNIKDIREFGNFELELPLPVEEYKIVSTEPKEKLKFLNGICIIKYELASEGAEATGKPEEEV